MSRLGSLHLAWSLVTEMDLQPLRERASRQPAIALVGKLGSGRHSLASQMRRDPARPEVEENTPLRLLNLEEASQLPAVDLVVMLMCIDDEDDHTERALVRRWVDSGVRVLVVINRPLESPEDESALLVVETSLLVDTWKNWGNENVLIGSVDDIKFLQVEFVPTVMRLLPESYLALGRYFPLFRVPVARHLINDTCFTNTTYSLTTGLVEIVPILNIPLNVADMIILTKNQIFLVYRLGLALGMSTHLQSYLSAFGGVLGVGFFWRQAARMMIGLIPGWGILPKVGVAYAGTYVVGSAVLQWYLTGSHVTKGQMRQIYAQAYSRGRQLASKMRPRLPRLRSGRAKRSSKAQNETRSVKECQWCGKGNALEASFCQYCGKPLTDRQQQLPAG